MLNSKNIQQFMDKSFPHTGENPEIRRRRSQAKFNKDGQRFQCFCSKQYLSYPALYLHLKNKHHTYFQNIKNGKRTEPTKFIEKFNADQGYKIFKIALDNNNLNQENERRESVMKLQQSNISQICYANMNNPMMFTNMHPQNFPGLAFMMDKIQIKQQRVQAQKDLVIEKAMQRYMQSIQEKSTKDLKERQLLFILLIDCVNQNFGLLKDHRAVNVQVKRYTAEYNSDYLPRMFSHFEKVYLPTLSKETGKPYSFFLSHSNIMTSGKYKQVLQDFINYLTDAQQNPKTITYYEDKAGSQQILYQSADSSQNLDGQEEDEQEDDEDNNQQSSQQ